MYVCQCFLRRNERSVARYEREGEARTGGAALSRGLMVQTKVATRGKTSTPTTQAQQLDKRRAHTHEVHASTREGVGGEGGRRGGRGCMH